MTLKFVIFILLASLTCLGQMTTQYDMYASQSWNSGTHTLTQTVTVEGITIGNCNNIPNACGATHTLKVANKLNYPSFNGDPTSSDWTVGPSGNPWSYMSFVNTQSISLLENAQIQTFNGASVYCSYLRGAVFQDLTGPLISIKVTYMGPPPIEKNDICNYTMLACSTGRPTCKSSVGIMFAPSCPQYIKTDNLVVGGVCLANYGAAASGPGPCN